MRNPETMLRIYEELANRYVQENQPRSRDHCLVLAADAALSANWPEEAERLRQRLLQLNPHHLLRPFGSMTEALQAPDVQEYVADLRRQWPPEFAQNLYLRGNDAPRAEEPEPPPVIPVAPAPQLPRARPALAPSVLRPAPLPPTPPPPPAVTVVAAPAIANPVGGWLATMLLVVGIAGGVGLLFLAFVWPLLD
jgi:hypothetical protein